MTKHYSATFTDGTRITRTSTSGRTYTHAWRVVYPGRAATDADLAYAASWNEPTRAADYLDRIAKPSTGWGFSGSRALAEKARIAACKGSRVPLSSEVVEVIQHATRRGSEIETATEARARLTPA